VGLLGGIRGSFQFLGGAGINHGSRMIHAVYIKFEVMITLHAPKIIESALY
jgi:hypothetical protein